MKVSLGQQKCMDIDDKRQPSYSFLDIIGSWYNMVEFSLEEIKEHTSRQSRTISSTDKFHRISRLNSSPGHLMKLQVIFEQLPYTKLKIWNSSIDQSVFEVIGKYVVLSHLQLGFSNIGSKMGKCLSRLNLSKLTQLVIDSDPINNRGLQDLMKLDFQRLDRISFCNTNLTADCTRTLKKSRQLLGSISFLNHQRANSILFIKQTVRNIRTFPINMTVITISPFYGEADYYHTCYLAKVQLNKPIEDPTAPFYFKKPLSYQNISCKKYNTIPRKVLRMNKCCIKIMKDRLWEYYE